MKKIFVMMLSVAVCATAAFGKIPAKITDAFQARYTSATNVAWQHSLRHYKASFDMGQYRFNAKFDRKGNWLGSKKMLDKQELPAMVMSNLQKSKYSRWEIKESYEQYVPHGRPSFHVVAAKGDLKRKDLVFSPQGQLING